MDLLPFDPVWFKAIGSPVISHGSAGLTALDEAAYFADPCPVPALSNSLAKVLLGKSPFHAWLEHPKFGNVKKPSTPWQERGTLIHGLVLGTIKPEKPKPDPNIEICDFKDWRTKAAREMKVAAIQANKIPMTHTEYEKHLAELDEQWVETEDALEVANCIATELIEHGALLRDQHIEHVGIWTEQAMVGPVVCKARLDILDLPTASIFDLKTANDANPKWLPKRINDFSYDVQAAAYTSFIRKLLPEMAGRETFTFLFAEELPKGSPKRAIVVPVELNGEFMRLGEEKWNRAVNMWAKALMDNRFPAYPTPDRVEPPSWAMAQLEAEAA